MSKAKRSLHFRLPPYRTPRLAWRREIHAAVIEAQEEAGVRYASGDRLTLKVKLYFDRTATGWHDVDNRLKDVMDALQGRVGGSKAVRPQRPAIPNDNQVYRVTVEKSVAPGQSHLRGHVWIQRL